MNESKELEEYVLTGPKTLADLRKRIAKEKENDIKKINKKTYSNDPKIRTITSIKDVPKDVLFSRNSYWIATNLATMIMFELSGINVDLYVGENSSLRKLLEVGHTDSFQKNGLFIQFHHAIVNKERTENDCCN